MQLKFKYKKAIIISLIYSIVLTSICPNDVHAIPVCSSITNLIGRLHVLSAGINTTNLPYQNVVFYRAQTNQKLVALTFDDGPDVRFTPEILDILKRNNVKATFFLLGKRVKAHPEVVKRIAREGHSIGNHSWNHPNLDRLSDKEIISQIQRTDNTLNYLLGYHPSLVRPPYGAANSRVVKDIGNKGYKIIKWSVDTRDWSGTPPSNIILNVRRQLHPGGIILQHCAGRKGTDLSNTLTALPNIIVELRSKGYRFVRIPELLGIPNKL